MESFFISKIESIWYFFSSSPGISFTIQSESQWSKIFISSLINKYPIPVFSKFNLACFGFAEDRGIKYLISSIKIKIPKKGLGCLDELY